jgi:uncharacterized integral membrane protein (TIGR00698 family)
MQGAARRLPGTALAVLVALAATAVSGLYGGPQLLYALFFGIGLNYLSGEARTRPGIEFCARTVLRLGVGLLGARITAAQIAALGPVTALVVVGAMAATIGLALLLARRFGLSRQQGMLTGGSVAICGASAALAISAVLPRRDDSERFTLLVVVAVTLFSTVAMVVYPLIAQTLGLPPHLAGLFLGGTIHDVAQVAGAGYMLGAQTGDVAIVVKLLRVSMLAFVVMALVAVLRARGVDGSEDGAGRRAPLVPWFLWLFVAMVVLNSAGALAPPVQAALGDVARACLLVAIAALGIKTSFAELARCGWRPLALILIETAWLALLVLGYVVWARG